ncbi:MAG TPA: SCO family protein [Anaerolineales bacterium]|nr:SCO family protein [Anaerolineales bacterium]HRF49847.1 SCO family protein [Anaerolineales bacterium]
MKKPVVVIVGMVVLGVALTLVADLAWNWLRPPQLHGMVLQSHERALDFTLNDEAGQPVKLSDFRGKLVLLYFGYTFCPDVCPATLAQVKEALAQLGGDAERVQLIMVSVDPERDTPEKVSAYVRQFDPRFIGLTGDPETLTRITTAYGVVYEQHEGSAATGYLIDHTATLTILDRDGYVRLIMPFGVSGVDMASDLRYLLTH